MKFGMKLKELRKASGYTQEELAECLCVSFQTISKWENEVSMPDVGMLPVIADCFNVTIDELLCYNTRQRAQRKVWIIETTHEKEVAGNLFEAYEFLNEKITEYPNDVGLNHLLAATAYKLSKQLSGKEKNEMLKKAMQIAEHVVKLDHGTTSKTNQAKMCIGYCLHDLGMQEEAERIAYDMPSMFSSREVMLFRILTGEKKRKQVQQNLEFLQELETEMKESFM